MHSINIERALQVALEAARDAGALLRDAYWRPRTVSDKGINDLVTESDRASEVLVSTRIAAAFPDHRINGEEGTAVGAEGAPTWWIDPLDGTYNFVHAVPRFSVSIALSMGNAVEDLVLGVVYDPMFDEMFWAVRGQGAHRRSHQRAAEPIRVSHASRMRDALVASGFPAGLQVLDNNTREWSAFVPLSQGVARMGSAALDLCYVACGRFELFWEHGLAPWDMGAGVLIATEAGGRVSRYDGSPFPLLPEGDMLASNGLLHVEATRILTGARAGLQA